MKHIRPVLMSLIVLGVAFGMTYVPRSVQRADSTNRILPAAQVVPAAVDETLLPPVVASQPVTLHDGAELLRQGHRWLKTIPDYRAVFRKQERVHGVLCEPETIQLKVRQAPFSVSMAWDDCGRQVYYRDGLNDNRLTVKMGGWKGRLGWINLDLHSTLALQYARYPVTDAGLLRLTEQLIERFEPYEQRTDGVVCAWQPEELIGGRNCRVFVVEYASSAVNPDYRRSVVWLDQEWLIPLAVENFDWDISNTENPTGLVEHYVYEEIHLEQGLSDLDFTHDARPVAETVSEVTGTN
ncbi:MAG: DUF1571 domain-containing protein [Planctomycetaceae bacterium]